ncbi:L,D-transpeptidase family protein [Streptomyces sp. NPDC047985]|uniref:L,D-transpeptidase family protein n=1 Tax=Streptomyces sp. NPDC047985 TaxID=3155384 RepID=UPI00341F3484
MHLTSRFAPRTAAAATLALAMTAPAALAQAETGRPAARAAATTLVFDKNPADPSNSTLAVYKGAKRQALYRAGSGNGSTDECALNKGWLPNGTYSLGAHTRTYNGSLIKGYAVALSNKKCAKGTSRTALFIHSEMNRNGSQGSSEARKWTDRNPNDFLSNGCIKLRPAQISAMFDLLDRIGWPRTLKVIA